MSESYCPLPWLGYVVKNNGLIRVCCHANQGPTRGILLKDDGTPYTYKDDISEARNCKMLRDIRLESLNGTWYKECIRCQREFKSKLKTRNQYEDDMWKEYFTEQDARKMTDSQGYIDTHKVKIRYMDLRFGNACNLSCRMCFATDSSGWYKNLESVYETDVYHDAGQPVHILKGDGGYYVKDTPYEWYKEQIFWDNLAQYKESLRLIYIAGGEPLLIQEHFDFLSDCVNEGHSKNIKIEYNSNLTFLPAGAIDIWNNFEQTRIGVSLDGVGKINDYIRYPSSFDNIINNIKTISDTLDNRKMWIACTIMVYNILTFPELVLWKINEQIKGLEKVGWLPIFTSHPLHRPPQLNIKAFPLESKHIIKQKLLDSIPLVNDTFERLYDDYLDIRKHIYLRTINGYINYMYQDDFSHHLNRFWSYNNTLDQNYNKKLEDYIPDIIPLLKG